MNCMVFRPTTYSLELLSGELTGDRLLGDAPAREDRHPLKTDLRMSLRMRR